MIKNYLNDLRSPQKSLTILVVILTGFLLVLGIGIKVVLIDKAEEGNPLSSFFHKPELTIPVSLGKKREYGNYQALYSQVNGKSYTIIDVEQKIPEQLYIEPILQIDIVEKQDFDRDGYTDYLVELDTGGSACSPGYAFVSVFPDGSSIVSSEFGECQSGGRLIRKNNKVGVQIEGYLEPTTNYFYQNGIITSEVLPKASNLAAENEINFGQLDHSSAESEISQYWDLNDDGVKEIIHCGIARSGIACSLMDSNGQDIPTGEIQNYIVRRLGMLSSKTNGYHDLVLEAQDVYRWNGSEYTKGALTKNAVATESTDTVKKENVKMDSSSVIGLLIIAILGLICLGVYFLPTILAVALKNKNIMAIAVINLLLGWIGIGWIIALIMAIWKKESQIQPVIYQGVQMTASPPEQKSEQ